MREIKFRAWHKEDRQMIDWFTLTQSAWNTYRGSTPLSLIYDILVARKPDFEVMQYTGLKDKNGKEIYEGDIIKFRSSGAHEDTIVYIIYCDSLGAYTGKRKEFKENYSHGIHYKNRIIIGNIHENPELL